MSGFNKTKNRLAMANSVRLYGHVLRKDDGHVMRLKVTGRKGGHMEEVG